MSMLALLGLLPEGAAVEGEIRFDGRNLLRLTRHQRREIAGHELAMVFQDPLTSLHPMLTVGSQLTEHMRLHLGLGKAAAEKRAETKAVERFEKPAVAADLSKPVRKYGATLKCALSQIDVPCNPTGRCLDNYTITCTPGPCREAPAN